MGIRVDTSGVSAILRKTKPQISAFLDAAAEQMATDIKLSMGSGGRYKPYRRQKGRKTHYSSMPGSPPNVDTGALWASIRWGRVDASTRRIVDGTQYGVFLEFGTSKMEARPFMRPVFIRWSEGGLEQMAVRFLATLEAAT